MLYFYHSRSKYTSGDPGDDIRFVTAATFDADIRPTLGALDVLDNWRGEPSYSLFEAPDGEWTDELRVWFEVGDDGVPRRVGWTRS